MGVDAAVLERMRTAARDLADDRRPPERLQGDDRRTAALKGTSEVLSAMVASTLTSVAVFAPIVFVTGIAGQIFGDQALTVVSFQFISLFMAVLLIPLMTSRTRWR